MDDALRIGDWTVRPAAMEMEPHGGAGTVCRLTPKAMAVLTCLADQAGRVVSREALLQRVWDGAFVSDDALSTVIYELRKAFDDKGSDPRYIETIRKGGYRLIAPVSTSSSEVTDVPVEPAAEASPPFQPTRKRSRIPILFTVLIVAAIALILYLTIDGPSDPARRAEPSEAAAVESLAVLPITLVDLEGQQDLLADALTEMLIADLAQICPQEISPGLAVRGQEWDLERAAQHLAVDAVVEGTLVRSGDRLWLSIQLVDVQTGQMLWGGSFEREVSDLSSLRTLAQDIALRVQLEVAPPVPGISMPGMSVQERSVPVQPIPQEH